MKPLILTGWLMPEFTQPDFADLAVYFPFRFVWGPLPSPGEVVTYLGPRKPARRRFDEHWSDFIVTRGRSKNSGRGDPGLAGLCLQYETVELWFDTRPNAQLLLIWLLDYFRSHPETIARLKLRLVNAEMIGLERLGKWRPPAVDVTSDVLETASAAWQAYCATTPEACFDLLGRDLRALPLLRPALVDLLAELPSATTGLGATEMRMLELISEGGACPPDIFPGQEKCNQRRVFDYWKPAPCWTAWRVVRHPLCRAWMRGLSHWKCTMIVIVTRDTNKAGCHSPNSARLFSPAAMISAGTTRSTAGGAGPN